MDFTKYLVENALILIPVLYILGMILKGLGSISNKYIPVILLVIGIILACLLLGLDINSVIQGVLITGVTVYANQLIVQAKKDE